MQPLRKLARKPLFWCALGVIVVAGVAFAVWPREPVYWGKPLSYWLDRLPATLPSSFSGEGHVVADFTGAKDKRAPRVVKALGSQCLPTLLVRLETKDEWKLKLFQWQTKHFMPFHSSIVSMVAASQMRRGQAVTALIALGDTAKPILPEVVKLARSTPNPRVRASALLVLRDLSPADYTAVTRQMNVVSAAVR